MQTKHFDLEHEIKNYLNNLLLNGNLTSSDEMEIENHLRDGVDSLTKNGLSDEEAFLITLKRTGNVDLLTEEYNKVNPFFVSNKIRSFSITGLALILSIGTIVLLLYDLLSMFRSVYLKQTTADTIVKASLYLALCTGILIILKWGNSFTMFLQKNIERKPFLTAAILFLLPLISFGLQSIIIRYIPRNQTQEGLNANFDINDVQYANFSFYLVIIASVLVTLIWFESNIKKRKLPEKKSFFNSQILFLIFFSIVICLSAGMTRYLPQITSGFQSSIFFGVVYTIGSFSIALYNNDKLWTKLFIFFMFSLFLGNLLVL
jgi:hypothetical protein